MEVIIPWNDGNGNIIINITYEEEGYDGSFIITSDSNIEDGDVRTQTITLHTTDRSIEIPIVVTQIGKYIQVYNEVVEINNEVYTDTLESVYTETAGNEYTNYIPALRSYITIDENGNEVLSLRIDETGLLRLSEL